MFRADPRHPFDRFQQTVRDECRTGKRLEPSFGGYRELHIPIVLEAVAVVYNEGVVATNVIEVAVSARADAIDIAPCHPGLVEVDPFGLFRAINARVSSRSIAANLKTPNSYGTRRGARIIY